MRVSARRRFGDRSAIAPQTPRDRYKTNFLTIAPPAKQTQLPSERIIRQGEALQSLALDLFKHYREAFAARRALSQMPQEAAWVRRGTKRPCAKAREQLCCMRANPAAALYRA
jgi:hypothetical protein